MKFLNEFLFFCLLVSLTACVNSISDQDNSEKITFNVTEGTTRSSTLSDNCKHLVCLDYVNGAYKSQVVSSSTDNSYGKISLDLAYGTHTLYFIGHNQPEAIIDKENLLLSFDKVTDTFISSITLTVDEDTKATQNITLHRCVAKFELKTTDAIPDKCTSVGITLKGGCKYFDLKNEIGTSEQVQSKTISISGTLVGTSNNSFSCYTFLNKDEKEVNIAYVAQDSEGKELFSKTFETVPLGINEITRYVGTFFTKKTSAENNFGISVDSVWSKTKEFDF